MSATPPFFRHVRAVIFDWAGTLVDFGSFAPTQIFVDAFASFGIEVSLAQASGPMGLSKRHHIQTLLADPAIQAQWQARFGQSSTEADIDALYAHFMPLQIAKVGHYSQPIPGAVALLASLRAGGLRLGSCSGYPREVMAVLLPLAREAGVVLDHVVAGDDLPAGGRPGGFMALANVLALQVPDVRTCIKVDDTVPGIEEGRNAGMWSVAVTLSGAPAGWTRAAFDAADAAGRATVRERVAPSLWAAGAHYLVDTVADLPAVLVDIDRRMARGERP